MKTYCIKPEYQHGTANLTFETEETEGSYWNPERFKATQHNQIHSYYEAANLMKQRGLKSVCDVGCGVGWKLVNVLEPVAQKAVGVDQPNAIKTARKLFPDSRAEFVPVDLEQPAGTGLGTFDLIISADVIEHLLDPDMLLNFIRAHCNPQTYVIISTPERDVRRGTDNIRSPKREHVREWNRAELKQYLETSGFEVLEQKLLPGFRINWSPRYFRERLRLLRKRVSYRYCQVAIARLRQ